MKTRTWILILGALFLVSLGLSLWAYLPRSGVIWATVTQNGEELRTVDLRIDQTFTVEAPDGGSNTLTVQNGRIAVTEADCPDGVCVRRGFCRSGQIICLPHGLVVNFSQNAPLDAVVG